MLTYRCTNSLNVVGYSDADFKGCVDNKKSTIGYIFVMERGVVSWRCAKQSVTASSISTRCQARVFFFFLILVYYKLVHSYTVKHLT